MFTFIWRLVKSILLLVFAMVAAVTLFVQFAPVFGGKPDAASMEMITASSNFDGQVFSNLLTTKVQTSSDGERSLLDLLRPPAGKNPTQPLPSKAFNKHSFKNGDFVWFSHSTILMKVDDLTIITDPIFYNAAPVSFAVKPFDIKVETKIRDLPDIDLVLISHDHYDHLDYRTIQELDSKVKTYLVPLGVKAHLQKWGVADEKIAELDWYQLKTFGPLSLTLTPARHFSGRGLNDRFSTLWGSWVVVSASSRVFFSGDSGYFDEFKKIGEDYGPFDIAFVENGAYNTGWSQVHMFPEQSVQAGLDLNAKLYFPIHWGKFDLAFHNWTDPITRATAAAEQSSVQIVTPMIGELFTKNSYSQKRWWESVR